MGCWPAAPRRNAHSCACSKHATVFQDGGLATCCPPNAPKSACARAAPTRVARHLSCATSPRARVHRQRLCALPGGRGQTARPAPICRVHHPPYSNATGVHAWSAPVPSALRHRSPPRPLCRAGACCARAATSSARAATAACATPATPSCACPSTSRRRALAPAVCMHGGHVWHRLQFEDRESACVCVNAPSRGRREAAWCALLACGRAAAAGAAAGTARAMHAACRRKRSAWHSQQCSPANMREAGGAS
jgi:hypothetical protein